MAKRALIFATTYYPLIGGAEVAVKEITDRLPEWEFDLVCARLQRGLPDVERVGRVTVHRCGFGLAIDKYLLPVLGAWRGYVLARTHAFDACWSLMASYGGFAALVYSWLRPTPGFLLTLQEGDPLERYAKRVGPFGFAHRAIFRRAHGVQAISRFLAAWASRMGFGGEPVVVPNGVDIPRFSLRLTAEERAAVRHELGIASGQTALITTSRLSLKNGVDDLIRSLAHLPTCVAVVVGTGEDEMMLRQLANELGVGSRVLFLGFRSHDELPRLLQAADIFVRPSLSEGLGNSFLEAMAAGLPIIGTPVGGIPDFLHDGETGIFCQPRDPDSIVRAVERVLADDALRRKLVEQGQRLVKTEYDWDGVAERMGGLLEQLAASRV